MAQRKAKTINFAPDKVRKPSGLKRDGTPNSSWRKFKERLEIFDKIPLKEWKYEEVLGYIFKRYSSIYDIDFSLSYSGPPSKCSEIYCIKRMMSVLGTEDPKMSKDFIDWTFDTIIIPKKMQIESLAFFFTTKLIREFKSKFKKSKKITRSTQVPSSIEKIIEDMGFDDIVTYGDLAFAKKAIEMNPDNQAYKPYFKLFDELGNSDFDIKILESLDG